MPLIAPDRIDRTPAPKRRQHGLTLVELTVTLLILTVLATIAIRSTNDLGFQVRYEQTKERLEMIRHAILGNPRLIINGQQAISGFVADMGRLPGSVRDLIQASACIVGGVATQKSLLECEIDGGSWTWFDTPCTDGVSTTKNDRSTAGGLWLGWQIHLESDLGYGWRGPYLNVSGNPDGTDTFTDGWGREAEDEADHNYDWQYNLDDPLANDLSIASLGKNQVVGGDDYYDADYPANQPVIRGGIGWLIFLQGLALISKKLKGVLRYPWFRVALIQRNEQRKHVHYQTPGSVAVTKPIITIRMDVRSRRLRGHGYYVPMVYQPRNRTAKQQIKNGTAKVLAVRIMRKCGKACV